MSAFKYAIFDLDGTLIDSLEDIGISLNETLAEYGFGAISLSECRRCVGHGLEHLLRTGFGISKVNAGTGTGEEGQAYFDESKEEIKNFYRGRYALNCSSRSRLYPGVLDGLKRINESGVQCVVVTNKPQGFAEKLLRGFDVDGHFLKVYGEDTLCEKKPSLLIWEDIVNSFSFEKEDCVMIGDGIADAQFAKKIGATLILVEYGIGFPEELRKLAGDFYARSFEEAVGIIIGA